MEAVMLVRYAEIHLKGLNRPYFERSLMKRISLALRPLRAGPAAATGCGEYRAGWRALFGDVECGRLQL